MTNEEHIKRHKELHKSLDELVADYIDHTDSTLSETNLMDFVQWSARETENPTEVDNPHDTTTD